MATSTQIVLKRGRKRLNDKEITDAIVQNDGNLLKAYNQLNLSDIRFFQYCSSNPDIRQLCQAMKLKKAAEFEAHMEELAYSPNPQTAFQATKFMLSHLNPEFTEKPALVQQITTQDGVSIKQIFGIE